MEPAKNSSPTRGLTGQLTLAARQKSKQPNCQTSPGRLPRKGKIPPRETVCPDIPFVRTFYCHSQYVVIKISQDFLEHSSGASGPSRPLDVAIELTLGRIPVRGAQVADGAAIPT
jgi:hypothetical protein